MMEDRKRLKEAAAQQIIEAVKFADFAGVNSADFGIPLSGSLFRNIRDAMFHFRALCDSFENEDQFMRHYYSLLEHLSRGEKDAVITFGRNVSDAVFSLMQSEDIYNKFNSEEIVAFRHAVHLIKNTFMGIRTGGMHVKDINSISVHEAWNIIAEQTEKIARICRKRSVHLF